VPNHKVPASCPPCTSPPTPSTTPASIPTPSLPPTPAPPLPIPTPFPTSSTLPAPTPLPSPPPTWEPSSDAPVEDDLVHSAICARPRSGADWLWRRARHGADCSGLLQLWQSCPQQQESAQGVWQVPQCTVLQRRVPEGASGVGTSCCASNPVVVLCISSRPIAM